MTVRVRLPCRPARWAQIPAAVAALFALCTTAWGQLPASFPVKIWVEVSPRTVRLGERAEVLMTLQDTSNRPVGAPKDWAFTLEVSYRSGRMETAQVPIGRGVSTARFSIRLREPGIAEIRVRHREVRDGAAFVLVIPRSGALRGVPTVPVQLVQLISTAVPFLALEASPAGSGGAFIALRVPRIKFLADGKDEARITVFLIGVPTGSAAEIRIRLASSGGRLDPPALVLRSGEPQAEAILTSDRPGVIEVEYVDSLPPPALEVQGERRLKVAFGPPVSQLDVRASPPEVSLLESAEIVVRLLNDRGLPVATDEPRPVSLAVDAGRGEIEARDLVIPAGQFGTRTRFLPTWRGATAVSATSPDLLIKTAQLQVSLPLALLTLSAVGGLTGGWLAAAKRRRAMPRIAVGVVTGFVLYWAAIFGALNQLPRAVALNPFSALVVSILGGWMGTEVLVSVGRWLGVESTPKPTRPKPSKQEEPK